MIPATAVHSLFLRQGELAVVHDPTVISTVLGSCVSFTFYHPRQRLAGMNHALLPGGERTGGNRYVAASAGHLLQRFLDHGVRREEIEVKLFGGADMFASGPPTGYRGVGRKNVEAALAFLEKERLRLVATDVGGSRGRKIILDSRSGEIYLQRLPRQVSSQFPR